MKRVLLIDNYDSFTFNLAQAFQILGAEVEVFRNDALTVEQAKERAPTHLVVSPGPGNPDSAGVSLAMLAGFLGVVPILGVCLGHQALVQVLGGRIVRAPHLMHGKASLVQHDGRTIYEGLPNPLEVGRYHSLIAEEASLPGVLEVTCRTDDGLIMGVRHREHAAEGVQFHPESVLTPQGDALLARFLAQ
ncbi:MAG: aminodeoxychorismate/anthranilate synthase component II [Alphaproteobacteria bacterium]|nr:aminodeoxychorismate/anthranilate synthase component II [Alphaproteobacteria bacterium]